MFYTKLAWRNLRKSFSSFAPFILSSVVMFVINIILATIMLSPSIDQMEKGVRTTKALTGFGLIVIAIFTVIILVYSYRFLLKQRSTEFGLYQVLGLGKTQITQVAFNELLILLFITISVGTIVGVIFSKFAFLLYSNLLGDSHFSLAISIPAILIISFLFVAIYLLLLVILSVTVLKNSSISLMHDQSKWEHEPKGSFILALLGTISLLAGYYIAVTMNEVRADLLYKFFIAVLLVIFGTYMFFLSFTIFVLKREKANKNYYYKPKNFIKISSMLYRMKQNAVGLANITILLSMSFVTLATTTGLYFGTEGVVNREFPQNTILYFDYMGENPSQEVKNIVENTSVSKHDMKVFSELYILANGKLKDKHITLKENQELSYSDPMIYVTMLSREDLINNGFTNIPEISDNEILVDEECSLEDINLYGENYTVKDRIEKMDTLPIGKGDSVLLIFSNQKQLEKVSKKINGESTVNRGQKRILVSLDLENQDQYDEFSQEVTSNMNDRSEKIAKELKLDDPDFEKLDLLEQDKIREKYQMKSFGVSFRNKKEYSDQMKEEMSGALFIGFILGMTFILGAALIIYYKQVSEGIEDKRTYKILQEVGLSKKEVAQTIKSQIITVFFLPLLLAVVHFAFAFKMINMLIVLFGVEEINVVIIVSIITILSVVIIYFLVYKVTSKVYYNIVER